MPGKRAFTILLLWGISGALALGQSQSPFSTGAAQQPTTQPAGLAAAGGSLMTRDNLTGNWGGLRDRLGKEGFTLALVYEAEVDGNWGGASQGAVTDGLLNLTLNADLEQLTGFFKDATLQTNFLYIYGPGLSQRHVGDFSDTSNIAGYNTFRLQELWLQQGFWWKRASLRAGWLAADTEFFASTASSVFINSTFGGFDLFASNIANAPIYPVASPGARLDVAPIPAFDLKAALFGMNANGPRGDLHGADLDIDTGPLAVFEAAYLVNQGPNDDGLIGSYKLGGFAQEGDYTTFHSQAQETLGAGRLSRHGTIYAAYGIIDQELYKHGDRRVEVFGRGGFAPGSYSFVDGYFDAGFNLAGFLPGRAKDLLGVGVARAFVSGDFSRAQQLLAGRAYSAETVVELTYKAQVAPWWTLQPDLQFILTPGGGQGARNATVLGLRTTFTF